MASIMFLAGLMLQPAESDPIVEESHRFEAAWFDAVPDEPARKWQLPFRAKDRTSLASVSVVSVFGAPRQSYLKGHLHTGVDLDTRPRHRGPAPLKVLAMTTGAVCSIHLGEPHTTVVVRHLMPDGSELFTSYKHLAEVYVRIGQQVDAETELGRLFTPQESKRLGGDYHHLHLEIRLRFDDRGVASWLTMNREDLDRRFLDPLPFMRKQLAIPAGLSPEQTRNVLTAAREALGFEYRFGGRLENGKDIDCLGLLFYAAEGLSPCGWKSYSVMPTELVKKKELGVPVPGMDPVAARLLDVAQLRIGDVVLLLAENENSTESPLTVIEGRKVWVWHTGIYAGEGNWIHADFTSGRVEEEKLLDFVNRQGYLGVFVLRMTKGPAPAKCLPSPRLRKSR